MSLKRIFQFFFWCVFLFHFSLFADGTNLSNSSSESIWPAIAVNSSGEIMVVWTEVGGSGAIYYRVFKEGTWSDKRKTDMAREYAWSNQLAVDSQGYFHLSYADGWGSLSRDIFYNYYTGSDWSKPVRIYRSHHNSAWNRMDVDSNNDIYITWYHKYGDGEKNSDVAAMHKKKGGSWPKTYENVSRSSSQESIHPAIRAKDGNVYVTWMEGEGRRIYFAEKVGGSWRTPIQVSQPGYYPALAVDDSGNIHIVYSNWSYNFFYKSRVNGKWSSLQVLSAGPAPLQFGEIRIKSNVLVAAWIQGTDEQWSVYGAAKIPGGQWTNPVKIADTPGGSDGNKHVQVALDNSGSAHFIWEGVGVGSEPDIFYKQYRLTGEDISFIEVDKLSFDFIATGSGNPSSQTFKIRNVGKAVMDYTISTNKKWLHASPSQGTSSGEWDTITVSVDASKRKSGAYSGTITITSDEAFNSPVKINVNLLITAPTIEVDKKLLEFETMQFQNPSSQKFQIRNAGQGTMDYTITSNKSWLTVSPEQGTSSGEWDTMNVSVDVLDQKAGSYKGMITITSGNASNSPKRINVNLTIKGPSIEVNKQSLDFEAEEFKNSGSQTFLIRNSGAATLDYTIASNKSWLTVSPKQGTSSGEWDKIKVELSVSNFAVGTYYATITITSPKASNSPKKIKASLVISKRESPYIQLDTTALSFSAFAAGDNPLSQTFRVRNYGTIALNYEVIPNKEWIKVTPAGGSSTGEWDIITVSIDIIGFGVEKQNGLINVKSSEADNSPQSVEIELDVLLPPYPYSPVNLEVESIDHEGLMIKLYKNKISWLKNPKNERLFTISKYKIYRKRNTEEGAAFVYLNEVDANTFTYYDGDFSSKEERDAYSYAVSCVDVANKESEKTESSG